MNVQEALDELQEVLLRDVSDAVDGDSDQLFSRASLVRYLDESANRFARATQILRDASTPELTRITLQQGVADYVTSPRVVGVLSAQIPGRPAMAATTFDAITGSMTSTTVTVGAVDPDPAEPTKFLTDVSLNSIRFWPTPSADWDGKVVWLRVSRLPLTKITLDTLDMEIELPEQFHLDLLEWAAYRALRNHDADAENMAKASAHRTRFEEAIEEGKALARSQMFAPMQFNLNTRW